MIENQQSATDDKYGPCLYVDIKTEGSYIKVTGCNETDERQSWYYTPKGQIKVGNFLPKNMGYILYYSSLRAELLFHSLDHEFGVSA